MGSKITIAFARREAELYRSQGLFEEAQQLYREVLDSSDTLGSRLVKSLRNQILKIEDELAAMEVDLVDYVSERDMQILKGSWRGANSPSDILPCATALGDIGLFEVGVEEYRKLIRLKLPVTDFVRGLTDCLLGIHSLDTIEGAIEQIINQDFPKGHKPVTLRAAFAVDMERRGYYRVALSLYEKLLKEAPRVHWVSISNRIKTLKSRMKTKTHSVEAIENTPSSQPADKSARFHRRLDRLRKQLHQLRAFMQRRRRA
jgi:tetratricopeptide (TPR) repeat protein